LRRAEEGANILGVFRVKNHYFTLLLKKGQNDNSAKFISWWICNIVLQIQGRIQDFKLGGAHLKKLRRAEGGAKIFGVFRVKNHDFKIVIILVKLQTDYRYPNSHFFRRRPSYGIY
jgi:hypothetical protein